MTRPSEQEVRELMAEYSEPNPPECRECGAQTERSHVTSESIYFRCPKCRNVSYYQNKTDNEIVAVCEDWLRVVPALSALAQSQHFRDRHASQKGARKTMAAIEQLISEAGFEEPPHA